MILKNMDKINCVAQCRVSSKKQSQEGESLENQEKTIRNFVAKKEWHIVPNDKVWSTAISGRKTDREDFEEILAFIKANPGLVQYYVFRSIDRATRAGGEEYARMKRELAKQGVQMIDTCGVIQPTRNTLEEYGMEYEWSKRSPSEMLEMLLAIIAKDEASTILTRMIGEEIKLTQQGYRCRRATDGFINESIHDSAGKKKPIQIPHPDRAKFYIAMFNLRVQGLSDAEIVKRINAMGYRSAIHKKYDKKTGKIIGKIGGVPLSLKQLQRIIQNPIYAGVICEKWTKHKAIKAVYQGLVDIKTFNNANRGKVSIKEYGNGMIEMIYCDANIANEKRNKNNPLFPYKFIHCPICNKPFRGSSPRGKSGKKFPTYHCIRKHKYFGVSKIKFENTIETFIKNVHFRPELLNSLEATFLNKYKEREKEIITTSNVIHQNIDDLKIEQAAKIDAIVTTRSSVIKEKLEIDVEKLEIKIKEAQKENLRIQVTEDDIKNFMQEAKKIMEHPAEILLRPDNMRVQRDLFELVFDGIPTYEEIASGTPKMALIFEFSSGIATQSQLAALTGVEPMF